MVPLNAVTNVPAIVRARVHHALQRISRGADQRQRRARVQLGPGHGGARRSVRSNDAARDGL